MVETNLKQQSTWHMPNITGYHSHVYYDNESFELAKALCLKAKTVFPDLEIGRMHKKPVGPHPDWSCQLSYLPNALDQVLPWLAVNRKGLTIFTHPITGDALRDHRDYAIWMGSIRPLNLKIFY